jgi:hypothetical protein
MDKAGTYNFRGVPQIPEDITDCDIIGENQELVTNCDRLDRMNPMFRI